MKLLRTARWLLLAFTVTLIPATSHAEVFISVGYAPPPLLVYQQPLCPGPGMIWTPGYWAYGPDGYYWVPGAWVPAPFVGALWTPGYWGWSSGLYYWHPGYWGYNVGYYGGINYGFGYFGIGFVGGRWHNGFFDYNTAVWRVNHRYVRHTYYDRNDWGRHYVDRHSRVAFNGGPGGIRHSPNRRERDFEHERRFQHTSFQERHIQSAMRDRNAYFNRNHGRPNRVVSERPLGRENRRTPQARPMNQPQRENRGVRSPFNQRNRNQVEQQNRQQQPQYRQQQRPQYRQQPEYRQQRQQNRQQPQYRNQQNRQPQYRQQPRDRGQQQIRQRPQGRQPQYRQQSQDRGQQQVRQRPQSRHQPQYRQQARPQYRQQPQPRNENRGRSQDRAQHGGRGHGR